MSEFVATLMTCVCVCVCLLYTRRVCMRLCVCVFLNYLLIFDSLIYFVHQ